MSVSCHLLLATSLQAIRLFYIFVTSDPQSFIFQNSKVIGLLGEKFHFVHSPGNSN